VFAALSWEKGSPPLNDEQEGFIYDCWREERVWSPCCQAIAHTFIHRLSLAPFLLRASCLGELRNFKRPPSVRCKVKFAHSQTRTSARSQNFHRISINWMFVKLFIIEREMIDDLRLKFIQFNSIQFYFLSIRQNIYRSLESVKIFNINKFKKF